jgi:hypothetical protein
MLKPNGVPTNTSNVEVRSGMQGKNIIAAIYLVA